MKFWKDGTLVALFSLLFCATASALGVCPSGPDPSFIGGKHDVHSYAVIGKAHAVYEAEKVLRELELSSGDAAYPTVPSKELHTIEVIEQLRGHSGTRFRQVYVFNRECGHHPAPGVGETGIYMIHLGGNYGRAIPASDPQYDEWVRRIKEREALKTPLSVLEPSR